MELEPRTGQTNPAGCQTDSEPRYLFAPDRTWHAYLEKHLAVPFVAIVIEDLREPIQQDEEGKVTKVFFLDEAHGGIVSVRQKRRLYHLPLYGSAGSLCRLPGTATQRK